MKKITKNNYPLHQSITLPFEMVSVRITTFSLSQQLNKKSRELILFSPYRWRS